MILKKKRCLGVFTAVLVKSHNNAVECDKCSAAYGCYAFAPHDRR